MLNMGAALGPRPEDVFRVTVAQATSAEQLGYEHLWVTEHHFIRFGINPSALTAAAFLLGRTSRIRVGTAVVLSPLYHPVELAERAALLDQFSDGRFALGLGRGGYRQDYEVLDIDFARWDGEPHGSARRIVDLWFGSGSVNIEPAPLTKPHPELLLATSSPAGIAFAAENGIALQHYFATPAGARVELERRYSEFSGDTGARPEHLHTVLAIVDERPDARKRLNAALRTSFKDGDHPHVPQGANRHVGPDGRPLNADAMADVVAAGAIIGSPDQVVDELGRFIETTGARRIAVFHEAIAEPGATLKSLEDFALSVRPQLSSDVAAVR